MSRIVWMSGEQRDAVHAAAERERERAELRREEWVSDTKRYENQARANEKEEEQGRRAPYPNVHRPTYPHDRIFAMELEVERLERLVRSFDTNR